MRTDAFTGSISGKTMPKNSLNRPTPSMMAASSNSLGMPCMNEIYRYVVKAKLLATNKRITPAYVRIRPKKSTT
ncbi:hypothetical protein D3C78_1814840 [compost metagenome]